MPGRILIGLDAPKHGAVVAELGIRWAHRSGATLVGLGIVDEPGIRAIEPASPVGGTPGVDPVYYMGYEARLAVVHRQVEELLKHFAARCDRGRRGACGGKIRRLARRADRGRGAVL